MLSREADAIYWMNRYVERAENVARFTDVNLHLMLDLPVGTAEQWTPLLHATGDYQLFQERYGQATTENVVAFLTFDAGNPNSIYSCLRVARENARSVRERITSEMWEQINKFYLMVRSAASGGDILNAPHDFFTEIKMASHLYAGITDATMSYGEGWNFGRLGRLVERAYNTSRILDVMYFSLPSVIPDAGTSIDDIQWSAVLKSASAFEMYRQRHGGIAHRNVAEFLMLDHEFPRSMYSCVVNAEGSLHAISGSPLDTSQNPAEERLGRVRADLCTVRIQEVIDNGMHEALMGFQADLNAVGGAVFNTFFTHRQVAPVSSPSGDAA